MPHSTYRQLAELVQYRSDLLMAGRHEDLARHYALPTITYLDGRPEVIADLDGLMRMFRRLRLYRMSQGITGLRAEVRAVEMPRGGRIRVWVRYAELTEAGETGQHSDCVLFLRQCATGLVSEMIEFEGDYERLILAA